jgi:hypothetical protein
MIRAELVVYIDAAKCESPPCRILFHSIVLEMVGNRSNVVDLLFFECFFRVLLRHLAIYLRMGRCRGASGVSVG